MGIRRITVEEMERRLEDFLEELKEQERARNTREQYRRSSDSGYPGFLKGDGRR